MGQFEMTHDQSLSPSLHIPFVVLHYEACSAGSWVSDWIAHDSYESLAGAVVVDL
jgi:hypothetical protein